MILSPDEITDTLARAESLYFEAKFKEAIQLLQHADDLLRPKTDRQPEKINVKLQLALAEMGLNDTAQARTSLREIYTIDADYRIDPQQFPPKVLALADEAKAEQNQVRCQIVRNDARKMDFYLLVMTLTLHYIGWLHRERPSCARALNDNP